MGQRTRNAINLAIYLLAGAECRCCDDILDTYHAETQR